MIGANSLHLLLTDEPESFHDLSALWEINFVEKVPGLQRDKSYNILKFSTIIIQGIDIWRKNIRTTPTRSHLL